MLGIQLSKTDVELAINAIEAPVAILDEPPAGQHEARKQQVPQVTPTVTTRAAEGQVDLSRDYTKESKVCAIQ